MSNYKIKLLCGQILVGLVTIWITLPNIMNTIFQFIIFIVGWLISWHIVANAYKEKYQGDEE